MLHHRKGWAAQVPLYRDIVIGCARLDYIGNGASLCKVNADDLAHRRNALPLINEVGSINTAASIKMQTRLFLELNRFATGLALIAPPSGIIKAR